MTIEEAIKILEQVRKCYLGGIVEAINMAIDTLKSQEPVEPTLVDMSMPDNAKTIDVAGVIQALKESYQKFSEDSDMFVDKTGYKYALIDPNLILDSITLLKAQNLTIEPKLLELEDETKAWLDEMDAVDALGNIANICMDYDGCRTANGLGELINEVRTYAKYCADRLKAREQQHDYETSVEVAQYCERYEPTYNPKDGSM